MLMEYICRYCHTTLGRINSNHVTEAQLGLDQLTIEEREDIIMKGLHGDCFVRVTCENCQQLLERNPELVLYHLYH